MAIMLKTWQTCKKSGNHAQNVKNMATVWQSNLKHDKYANKVAIINKTWQTMRQCGKSA